jgi:probable phosphoglycerate mutase
MTRLALIRHAPTAWNAEGRIQGRSDIPLSPEGRVMAGAWRLPSDLGGPGWFWLSSPLRRARETAALLNPQGAIRIEDALIEMDWGDWEGSVLADLRARGGDEMRAAEARGLDFQPPGGESPRMVQQRLAPFLAALGRAGGSHVAVTHKGVIRALYAQARGWDMIGRPPEKLRQPCVHLFEIDKRGQPSVVQLNLELVL